MFSKFVITDVDGDYHLFTIDIDREPYYGVAMLYFNDFKITFVARKGKESPSYFKKDKADKLSQYINSQLNG